MDSTIDEKQVKYFATVADDWWSNDGWYAGLHTFNKIRVPIIRDAILSHTKEDTVNEQLPLSGFTILDAGCGGGILSEALAKLGAQVTGIDPVKENIERARAHALLDPNLKDLLKYEVITVEDVCKRQPGSFDAVVSSEVVEHVSNPQLFITSCADLVKPGGSLFFTTINRTVFSFLCNLAAQYIFRVYPVGHHEWSKYITPSEMDSFVLNRGFTKTFHSGMWVNPITLKWSQSKLNHNCYATHYIKNNEKLTISK